MPPADLQGFWENPLRLTRRCGQGGELVALGRLGGEETSGMPPWFFLRASPKHWWGPHCSNRTINPAS